MSAVIFLVDIQSFYASIEKAANPHLRDKPVIVCGDPKRRSGVVLAACPISKSYGIKNAIPLHEALLYCPHVTVIQPRMARYLDVSIEITKILERFSDKVEPYSIDEQFISIGGSEKLFGPPLEIAKKIQHTIQTEIGVSSRIGIGPNKVLSKMACDHFSKRNQSGIFWLDETNMKQHLWPLPIKKMFGVGKRYTRHLTSMGICTIEQLAKYPVERLIKRWGINGHVLWMTANGIDPSPVTTTSFHDQKGIGHHMTLPVDYSYIEEIRTVLLELCEEVCRRLRNKHLIGQTVTVSCQGNSLNHTTGFHRQMKMSEPTNETITIFRYADTLFQEFWNKDPIRSIGIGIDQLRSDHHIQLSLFEEREKKLKIGYVMDEIKKRFGPTAILRASSLSQAGQALERAQKIGGHYK